jgi:hypothetical protein
LEPRNYARLAAVIFAVIAVLQLLRAIFAWEVTLNGVAIPIFVSGIACFIAAAMMSSEAERGHGSRGGN